MGRGEACLEPAIDAHHRGVERERGAYTDQGRVREEQVPHLTNPCARAEADAHEQAAQQGAPPFTVALRQDGNERAATLLERDAQGTH